MELQKEIHDFDAFSWQFFRGYNWIGVTKIVINAFGFINAGYPRRPFILPPENLQRKVTQAILEKYGEVWK